MYHGTVSNDHGRQLERPSQSFHSTMSFSVSNPPPSQLATSTAQNAPGYVYYAHVQSMVEYFDL